MRKTLVERLAKRINEPAAGDLIEQVRIDCAVADETAAMEDALQVWAEANAA